MCIQNLVKFCPSVLKILSGNEILTSIKGHNSVANFQKMTLYNPNLDLKILSGNEILTSIKGRNSVANLHKNDDLQYQRRSCQNNVYTKFGLILSIHSQDIEKNNN